MRVFHEHAEIRAFGKVTGQRFSAAAACRYAREIFGKCDQFVGRHARGVRRLLGRSAEDLRHRVINGERADQRYRRPRDRIPEPPVGVPAHYAALVHDNQH